MKGKQGRARSDPSLYDSRAQLTVFEFESIPNGKRSTFWPTLIDRAGQERERVYESKKEKESTIAFAFSFPLLGFSLRLKDRRTRSRVGVWDVS